MTEIEAKEILKPYIDENCMEYCGDLYVGYDHNFEAIKTAINALEKQEKIKESFEKFETDTSGIYCADYETTHLIIILKNILRSDEE